MANNETTDRPDGYYSTGGRISVTARHSGPGVRVAMWTDETVGADLEDPVMNLDREQTLGLIALLEKSLGSEETPPSPFTWNAQFLTMVAGEARRTCDWIDSVVAIDGVEDPGTAVKYSVAARSLAGWLQTWVTLPQPEGGRS